MANPVQVLLSRGAAFAVPLIVITLLVPGWRQTHGQQTETTLYLDSATAAPGEMATTQLVLFMAPGDSIAAFDVEVSFDPDLLTLAGVTVSPGWEDTTNAAVAGMPTVRVAGARDTATCSGGSTCLLATVTWHATGEGESLLRIVAASLTDETGDLLEAGTSGGSILVTAGGAAASSDAGPDGSLGFSNALLGLGVLLLAAAALSAPIVVWQLRRRSRPPTPGQVELPDGLASAVSQYLSSYESAGRVDDPLDAVFDGIAQHRISPTPNRSMPTDRLATMRHRPTPRTKE